MIRRERPVCEHCGIRAATEVDHIVPLAEGGARLDRANLQALCHRCHMRKGAADLARRRGGGG